MECKKCKETFEPGEAGSLTYTQGAVALMKDWKNWVFAFVIMLLILFLLEGVGLAQGWGSGIGGGTLGLLMILRVQNLRKCPKCGAVVRIKKGGDQ